MFGVFENRTSLVFEYLLYKKALVPASRKFARTPAPDSTLMLNPFLTSAAVTAGVTDTRRSPMNDSLGTPTAKVLYGTPRIGSTFLAS